MSNSLSGVESSVNFFTQPLNYGQFTVDVNGRPIVLCIDPRPTTGVPAEEGCEYPIPVQTGGGEVGMVVDMWSAACILDSELLEMKEAQRRTHEAFLVRMGAHGEQCVFVRSAGLIACKASEGTAFTRDTVERMRHGIVPDMSSKAIDSAYIAMGRLGEVLGSNGTLLAVAEAAGNYSTGFKYGVVGQNQAQVHITNYTQYGINRRDMEPHVQGYHDSIAALLHEVVQKADLTKDQKIAIGAAALVRTAATCEVLLTGHPDARLLEVHPSTNGVEVIEVPRAA